MPIGYVKTQFTDSTGEHEVGESFECGASELETLVAYGILTTDKPEPQNQLPPSASAET